jgi:hypothetical protein
LCDFLVEVCDRTIEFAELREQRLHVKHGGLDDGPIGC